MGWGRVLVLSAATMTAWLLWVVPLAALSLQEKIELWPFLCQIFTAKIYAMRRHTVHIMWHQEVLDVFSSPANHSGTPDTWNTLSANNSHSRHYLPLCGFSKRQIKSEILWNNRSSKWTHFERRLLCTQRQTTQHQQKSWNSSEQEPMWFCDSESQNRSWQNSLLTENKPPNHWAAFSSRYSKLYGYAAVTNEHIPLFQISRRDMWPHTPATNQVRSTVENRPSETQSHTTASK